MSTLAFDVNGQKCGNRQGTFLKKENQMHVFIPDLLDQMGREVTILVDHFLLRVVAPSFIYEPSKGEKT